MGLILVVVGLAVPSLSNWIAIPLVFGTIVNPFLFVPPAFSDDVDERLWYRVLALVPSSASRAASWPSRSPDRVEGR
ncbi:MAG: hypothetical protein M3O25_06110 [Actinomycetota bacterium]|nr:hypothetical protein [Actinomycetota bacterium]